jgi:DNA-directed RNA polymerase specialized sigma24 family protein
MSGGEGLVQSLDWSRMAERDLVRRARSGNKEAFGELVHRHRSQVYGWARKMTRDAYLADDIVQDAFIDAYVQMGSLLDESRFGPWLRKIVRNRAYMRLPAGWVLSARAADVRHDVPRGATRPGSR